jgi:hypothetical protein
MPTPKIRFRGLTAHWDPGNLALHIGADRDFLVSALSETTAAEQRAV